MCFTAEYLCLKSGATDLLFEEIVSLFGVCQAVRFHVCSSLERKVQKAVAVSRKRNDEKGRCADQLGRRAFHSTPSNMLAGKRSPTFMALL